MKHILLSLLLMFTFESACFASITDTMDKVKESWMNYPIDSLITVWGAPSGEKNIAEKTVFFWHRDNQVYIPQSSYMGNNVNFYSNEAYRNGVINSHAMTGDGYNVDMFCDVIVGVDSDKNINYMEWSGNACASSKRKIKKLVNPDNNLFSRDYIKRNPK